MVCSEMTIGCTSRSLRSCDGREPILCCFSDVCEGEAIGKDYSKETQRGWASSLFPSPQPRYSKEFADRS